MEDLKEWIRNIRQHNGDTLFLLVCNKCDQEVVVTEDEIKAFLTEEDPKMGCVRVSAKTGEGVEGAVEQLVQGIYATQQNELSKPSQTQKKKGCALF